MIIKSGEGDKVIFYQGKVGGNVKRNITKD